MPRNITVTLADGTKHVYRNAPDNITPQAVQARAQREFGMNVTSLDGGRSAPAPGSVEAHMQRWSNLPPAQAAALVQRFKGHVDASDPQFQALQRIAGNTAPTQAARAAVAKVTPAAPTPSNADRATAAGKAAAQAEGQPGFFNALKAGLIRTAGFGIPERLAAAGERYLPSAITGNTSDASYDDILKAVRAKTDAEAQQSGTGNFIGSLLGGGLTGGAAGRAVGAIAGRAAVAAPTLARAASAVATAAPKTTAVARVLGAGAAGGAAQAAGEGSDVTTGATTGAAAAGAFAAGGKALMPILQRAGDFLGASSAKSVLRRYTTETAESLAAKAADFRARTGTEPTVFELLGTGDRQSLRKAVGLMPETARENLAENVRTRAAAIGTDQTARTAAIISDAQDTRAANLAQQLADSRNGGPSADPAQPHAPTPEETALAQGAVRDRLDMDTVRRTVNSNIMAPHEDTRLYNGVTDLYPQHPENIPGGGVRMVEDNPQVSRMIDAAAGSARLKRDGITGSDVTAILSKLRKTSGKGGIEGGAADDAIEHITGLVDADHPVVSEAMGRMAEANAANHRILEGMDEGARTRVRADAPPTQEARNAFDTPEGAQGRAMGQAAELERTVGGTPEQALRATREIGSSPKMQAAISANLGDNAGQQIADSAAGVSESARRLSGLSNEAQGAAADPVDMLHGLMALSPHTLPHTKAMALARLVGRRGEGSLPDAASNQIVDALFSQNPAQISRAMTMLHNAGDTGRAVMNSVNQALTTGAAGTALSQDPDAASEAAAGTPDVTTPEPQNSAVPAAPEPDPSTAPAPAENAATDDSGPASDVGEGVPVDVANSPYLDHLKGVYASENPDLLDLSDRIQHQESGGHQHGADGRTIISHAGAIGTMQIMPGTAPEAARAAGLPVDMAALHNDPVYNKALGIAHIGTLLKHYGGDPVKAAAAYNAGTGNVDKAIARAPKNWVAYLPAETQDYIRKVS